jgi:hypothetical protein
MVLGRPLQSEAGEITKYAKQVTFLSEETLRQRFPLGTIVDVAVIDHHTNFFLGLNAGRWLTIRMNEITQMSAASCKPPEVDAGADQERSASSVELLLEGTGLKLALEAESPPEDSTYLFEHMGMSGNGGLSGQTVLYSKDTAGPKAAL